MDWTRRNILLSAAASLGLPGLIRGAKASTQGAAPNLVVVLAEGGWDVTYLFDPKLGLSQSPIEGPEVDPSTGDGDVEATVQMGNLPLVLNPVKRPLVTQFFDRWADRVHIVNGVWTGSIAHIPCRYRILTGTPDGGKPDAASIVGYEHGGQYPLGSVDLSGYSISGPLAASAGRIGFQSQIAALVDGQSQFQSPIESFPYPIFEPTQDQDDRIEAFLLERAERMRDRLPDGAHAQHLDNFVTSLGRASQFQQAAPDVLEQLSLGRRTSFLVQCETAVKLLSSQTCKAVTVDTRATWDTHNDNSAQHEHFQLTFSGLDALATGLQSAGLLENTVVAVLSEMTRTPLRNSSGGKDHWGHTSAMFFGGPIRGNAVSGATDDLLESLPMDLQTGQAFVDRSQGELCKYDNLVAGILDICGVDAEQYLPNVTPFRGFV